MGLDYIYKPLKVSDRRGIQLKELSIGKGAAYIFIERAIGLLSGFLLWIGLTRIATPDIIGTASAVVSLATIFTIVATMGIPVGVSRFLAKSFHDNTLEEASLFVKASLIFVSLGILASIAILVIIKDWVSVSLGINLMISSMILIASGSISFLIHSIVLATLKTKVLPIVMVFAATTRIIVVVVLVLMNTGALGVVMGYASFEILTAILLAITVHRIFRSRHSRTGNIKLNYPFRSILSASIPNLIPRLITSLGGSSLGTIVVFGFNGASQAASYFLANAIFSAIATITAPLFTIAYPALSAMGDGRKRFAWRILKISIILSLPLSWSVFFYSSDIVLLLGHDYIDASLFLKIFMITILPNSVNLMVSQLVYAYGNYRQVLVLGLASSIPRTLLYFLLVPSFGGMGAATSFLVGSIIGFVVSIIVAKQTDMMMDWKSLGLITAISFLPALILAYFQINFIVGTISTIGISFIAFLKFRILTKSDIEDTVNVLPASVARPLNGIMVKVGRLLNGDY
jgi:O-antigen/teichoic acid export membrane protein